MTTTENPTHIYWRPIAGGERSSLSVLGSFVQERSRVLDLGIGSGTLGQHLRQQLGCRLDGVTINPDEQAIARSWYERIEVLDLDKPGWGSAFDEHGYDAIVCADVLEHLAHPELVLQACHRLLRPDGVLLVSVPNVAYAGMVAHLLEGNFDYGNEGLLDRTHLRFFTRRSFERLLGEHGWAVRQVEPVAQPLHETEFRMAFDALPPAVGKYLLAQPDANTYQLVFAASREASASPVLRREMPPPQDVSAATFVAQLFFASDQGFSADRKMTRHGKIGVERQQLVFDLPASLGPWPALRLDPADRPGFFWLRRMTLRGATGQSLWEWSACAESAADIASCSRHQLEVSGFDAATGSLKLLMLGDDPHFSLPLPEAVARESSAQDCRLEVECGWPMSADYLAAAERFSGMQAGLQNQAGRIRELEEALARRSRQSEAAVAAPVLAAAVAEGPAAGAGFWARLAAALSGRSRAGPEPQRRSAEPQFDPVVEVVVPIYGNLPLVQRCLRSVEAASGHCAYHLTLVNDASPEPAVREWLHQYAVSHPGVTVIENARNLGFVETVNLGMRLAGRRDVVLLNSDTEVANDWLDRLRAAALSQESVGTVTPFSNNATICSYPQFCVDNPLLPGHDTASTDRLCAAVNRGRAVDIPTAVGFCMYIRRACLDRVGEFDAANFGKGYGEENDFCLRATALGWRHLHALDVFVYHEGGASFKESRVALQANALQAIRRLHPGYEDMIREFVQRDPARPFREALDRARATGTPV
jgi:GT2 family glycosyltransferase/2-polyprenyl-3-methyl-5-hydroxy-6-metoxy-1,4-benzoquinol methylase